MAVAGALIGGAIGAFGKKPEVPGLTPIDPTQTAGQTIAGNLSNLSEAERLAAAVNASRRRQGTAALEAVAPGASKILASGTQTIAQMLKGQIPEDVALQVQQRAASQALGGGYGGTGMSGALTARDLGLTSLNLVQQGLSTAESWLSGALQLTQPGGFFDVSSMMFTPQERLQFDVAERNAQFQRNLLYNQVEAAPDPATAALGREVDRFFNTIAAAGMMAAGGAMGGGGGAGMASGMMGSWQGKPISPGNSTNPMMA